MCNHDNHQHSFSEDVMANFPMVKIEEQVMDIDLQIYDPKSDEILVKSISEYQGKWTVLFFYPADFTFVCPTELKDLNKSINEIKAMGNVEVLVVSTDTVFSHKSWIEMESLLNGFEIPMVSDRTTLLSRYFGVLNEESGNAERGTFIISPEGILKAIEVVTGPVGRSSNELIRKLKALKFVTENPGVACPASWNTDAPVLKPSIKIAGHVGDNM